MAEDAGDTALGYTDAELLQLPDDAQVAPAGILTSKPHDQLDGISRERRSPGSMGIAPAAADESTMPAKDRLWRDEERRPPLPWHQPRQDCDQCPVRPRELGPSYLTAKDSQLLAEHQDLRVLGDGVHATDPYELDQVADQAVEEAERHRAGASPDPWCLVKPRAELLGPFRDHPRVPGHRVVQLHAGRIV